MPTLRIRRQGNLLISHTGEYDFVPATDSDRKAFSRIHPEGDDKADEITLIRMKHIGEALGLDVVMESGEQIPDRIVTVFRDHSGYRTRKVKGDSRASRVSADQDVEWLESQFPVQKQYYEYFYIEEIERRLRCMNVKMKIVAEDDKIRYLPEPCLTVLPDGTIWSGAHHPSRDRLQIPPIKTYLVSAGFVGMCVPSGMRVLFDDEGVGNWGKFIREEGYPCGVHFGSVPAHEVSLGYFGYERLFGSSYMSHPSSKELEYRNLSVAQLLRMGDGSN